MEEHNKQLMESIKRKQDLIVSKKLRNVVRSQKPALNIKRNDTV